VIQPVGQKLPNLWGLYDMHGNVQGWCRDGWSYVLPGGIAVDPEVPYYGGNSVLRGGPWTEVAWACRSAYRINATPTCAAVWNGFRVVLAPGQP
jgi:sulfatase modifying factor 1